MAVFTRGSLNFLSLLATDDFRGDLVKLLPKFVKQSDASVAPAPNQPSYQIAMSVLGGQQAVNTTSSSL